MDLNKKLQEWENFYNFTRPHSVFNGRTPYEVLGEKHTICRGLDVLSVMKYHTCYLLFLKALGVVPVIRLNALLKAAASL